MAHNSFTRNKDIELRSIWQLPDSEAPAVTHLVWSPWTEISTSQKSNRVSVSVLAASRNDGSVHLSKVILRHSNHNGDEIQEVQTDTSRELLPKNRLAVTKLAWTRRQDDLILAVCINRFLVVSIHPIGSIQTLASAMAMCRHGNYSPVVRRPPHCCNSLRINHLLI